MQDKFFTKTFFRFFFGFITILALAFGVSMTAILLYDNHSRQAAVDAMLGK